MESLECSLAVDLQMLGSLSPAIKSVCWDNENGKVLVGTMGNEVWEVSSSDGSNCHTDGPLEQGHFDNELWGLSINPTQPQYCTVGDDKTLRIWDLFSHKLVKTCGLEMMSCWHLAASAQNVETAVKSMRGGVETDPGSDVAL